MARRIPRFTKGLLALLAIVLASVTVGVVHYAHVRGDVSVSTRAADPPRDGDAARTSSATFGDGKIRVFFAPCPRLTPSGIDEAFLDLLNRAQHSIFGAFYELQLPDAAKALIAKHAAGVDVRLVSDSDYRDRKAIQSCIEAGIPVVFDERTSLMHDKFCIVDNKWVWTGSTNITENCMYRNNNNALLIASEPLAGNYTTDFEEMFVGHTFGKGGTNPTPYPEVTVGAVRIECYFAPEDHVQAAILSQLEDAKTAIDVMAFSFTDDDIARAMAARIANGVRVRALFDTTQAGSAHSQDEFLARNGAQVFLDTNERLMHNKVIIIDTATVITGSYNFTHAAETKNDENLLVLHAPDIAQTYEREFESLLPQTK